MYDKKKYVLRKYMQVVIPLAVVSLLASGYIIVFLATWLICGESLTDKGLFEFSLVVVAFSLPFYGIIRLIRSIVLSRLPE